MGVAEVRSQVKRAYIAILLFDFNGVSGRTGGKRVSIVYPFLFISVNIYRAGSKLGERCDVKRLNLKVVTTCDSKA